MTSRTSRSSALHDRIADDLRTRIGAGEYGPGASLPPMRELQAQWKCSDGPVRDALAILKGEGLITVSRGAPARVRIQPDRKEHSIAVTPEVAQAYKDLALRSEAERSSTGTVELSIGVPLSETEFSVTYEHVAANAELANEFKVKAGTDLLRRTYRTSRKETGKLMLFSVSHIPTFLIESNPALLDPKNEPWPGGHWHQLYTVGIEIDRLENVITAIQPTTIERQDWGMDHGVPLLCLRSLSIDILGRVVEVAYSTYPADRTEIRYTQQLTRWPDVPAKSPEES
ncbi:GntR family transcriptional regulator [Paractinoplanes atraurantiacus]|uniref:GntR family transcriptional regulator n=1 Tax=Paractinoplanes atraurantiacus TaxID=1036182 RepID=A0A285IVS9_9ACTN|nr:GntR family transcriptional regulator [Actinoplanes atraurantiacus]SNY52048.1 GntR family transcriptional regulator [Actinoplanes atraurantiacus]